MILADSATQNVGIAIAVLLVLGWLAFVIATAGSARREVGAEVEIAPNRKDYYDDDGLETVRLDRALAAALGMLVIVGVGLPLYWVAEPGRQEGAITNFDATFVSRGATTYLPGSEGPNSFGCQNCHGPDGVGGAAPFVYSDPITGEVREVTWQAPALNTVLLRHSPDEVRDIIVFGRAGTPMPPWGTAGGGPMNEQQVSDLIAYLQSIQLDPAEVAAQFETDARAAVANGNAATYGEALFNLACARCHTQGFSIGEAGEPGGGAFGPSLLAAATIRQFPNLDDHVAFIDGGSNANEAYGVRGIGSGRMPGFGMMLTIDQIRAIVEYERGLGLTDEERAELEASGGRTGTADGADDASSDAGSDDATPADEEEAA